MKYSEIRLRSVIVVDDYNNNGNVDLVNVNEFTTDENFILKNDAPLNIKGVVYVPAYPGFLPWELETSTSLPVNLKQSIDTDINNIKAMGANTIRFWGAPKYCYEAIKNIGGLNFL